jgi:hypothetical protein
VLKTQPAEKLNVLLHANALLDANMLLEPSVVIAVNPRTDMLKCKCLSDFRIV